MRRFLKTTGLIIVLGLCLAGCKFPGAKENVVSESTDSTASTDTTPVSVEPDEPDDPVEPDDPDEPVEP